MSANESTRISETVYQSISGASVWSILTWFILGVLCLFALLIRPQLFVANFVNGLVYGGVLVLIALGLSLILGLMEVINFAHGALFLLGAYFSYQLVAEWGISFWAVLIIAPLAVGIVGLVIERAVIRHLYDKEPIVSLLATFGLTMMITEAVRFVWGARPLGYEIPPLLESSTTLFVTQVGTVRLFTVAVAAVVVAVTYALITKTEFGLSVRAGVQDGEMAEFVGVNLPVRFAATFFIGATIAGLAGVLRASQFGLGLSMGQTWLILAFVVVVVGGAGSLFGSVVSGLLIGQARFLTPVVLTAAETVTGLGWIAGSGIGGLVPYLVMIIILLVRPRGLYGEEGLLE